MNGGRAKLFIVGLITVLIFGLAACAGSATPEAAQEPATEAPTEAVEPTAEEPAEEATEEPAEEATEEPAEEATEEPAEESAAEATEEPAEAIDETAPVITGVTWQLVEIQYMDDSVSTPDDPSRYTLLLQEDGTAVAQLDCNRGSGSFEMDAPTLTFGPMATTMAACPPDSLADEFARGITDANSFVVEDGDLFIAFGPDAGILHMTPAEEAEGGDTATSDIIEATFVCPDGTSIDAVFDNTANTVTITLPDETLTLPQTVSGSGARYSDDTTTFWNKGNEAMVEVNGETVYEGCTTE